MKAQRRRRWLMVGVAVAAMVVATGCGKGNPTKTETGVGRPPVNAVRDTAKATPPTSAPAGVASPPATQPPIRVKPDRPAAETPPARPTPPPPHTDVVPNPTVTTNPMWGGAGDRVFLDGYGFSADYWQGAGHTLWLTTPAEECQIFALAENDVHVTTDGHLTGSFVVPPTGRCGFAEVGPTFRLNERQFDIAYQCTECRIGTFYLLTAPAADPPDESVAEPTGTDCGRTLFSHGAAKKGQVYADGLSCEAAQPVVSDNAWAFGPVDGPAHTDAGDFSCDLVAQRLDPAEATYKCTNGAQIIWFVSS